MTAMIAASGVSFAHSGDYASRFGVSGVATMPSPSSVLGIPLHSLAVDRDSRMIFGASTFSNDLIGALAADGSSDMTFGIGGFVALDQPINDFKVDSRNRIVVLETDIGSPDIAMRVTRLNADGSVDMSFGSGGVTEIAYAGESLLPSALALDASGNIFVVGTEPHEPVMGDSHILVAKLSDDGNLDKTFGGIGSISLGLLPAGTEQSNGADIAIAADGSIGIAG